STPMNVKLSMFGTIRTQYSNGTTFFGSFPGVVANSNGFSACMVGQSIIKNRLTKKRNGERIARTKQPVPKIASANAAADRDLRTRCFYMRLRRDWDM